MTTRMMPIAGRGEDGFPKAPRLKNDGRTEVSNNRKRSIFEGLISIDANDKIESSILESVDFSKGSLFLTFAQERIIEVILTKYRKMTDGSFQKLEEETVYVSLSPKQNHSIEYELSTDYYSITIVNAFTAQSALDGDSSYEILSNEFKNDIDVNPLTEKGNHVTIDPSQSHETEMFKSHHNNFSEVDLFLTGPRNIKVSVQFYSYSMYRREHDGTGYEVIYESKEPQVLHSFCYRIHGDYYSLKIENVDTRQFSIINGSTEFLSRVNRPQKQEIINRKMEDTLQKMAEIAEKDSNKLLKKPTSTLKFKEANIPEITAFTKIDDEKSLVISNDDRFNLYKNVTSDNPELLESGFTWSREDLGRIANVKTTLDGGIVIFANHSSNQARIYKMADIHSEPALKYESNTAAEHESRFALRNAFGIKSYDNGLNTLILAGVYGQGIAEKDLVLSTDNGETFKVIKKTAGNATDNNNSHWHDVAFDIYNGLIWASEGDGETNHNVWWSDNLGETWSTVKPELSTQPTALIAFPDKLIMGRDSDYPGLDIVRKAPSSENYSFETHFEFKKHDTQAHEYYAQSPFVDGAEAYISFSVFEGKEPRLLIGTGDYGESWYFVFMGYGSTHDEGSISSFLDMDDDYVYASMSTVGAPGDTLLYAERVKWE